MDLTPYLQAWRTVTLRDRQVIDALVDPAHGGPSQDLARALRHWPGRYYWSDDPDGRHLILTRRSGALVPERWWLHALLFGLTLLTTTWAGTIMAGVVSDSHPLAVLEAPWRLWAQGLWFSLPLLAILLTHEMGHFLTARYYLLDASPPYFIPMPLIPSFIGTMGAFIRLRTIVTDRRQLFDVGVAGPIAGFVVALPVLALGIAMSHPLADPGTRGLVLSFGGAPAALLGDSAVTLLLRLAMHGGAGALELHPLAFAGWVGMFVTMLNLLPIAQLDGGHILYAAVPRVQERVALGFWLLLLGLGYWWSGWFVWAGLVLVISRGRLGHPSVLDNVRALPRSRRLLAWSALTLFLLTFAPVPFRL